MAAEDPPVSDRIRIGFMCNMSSAACEWFLILFLSLHASLSHILSLFTNYCHMEIPCILYSRLDEKNPTHYWNLLSRSHRHEISCLTSSDTEPEFPFSDDEDDNRSSIGNKPSLPDLNEGGNGNGDSLSEDEKTISFFMSELMSLGDDQRLFDFDGDSNVLLPQMQALSVLSEFLSLCNAPTSCSEFAIEDIAGTSQNEGDTDTPMAKNTEAVIETSSEITSIKPEEYTGNPDKDDDLSIDGSMLSETECENIVHRLIWEAKHDKNFLTNLCKDLEEEGCASTLHMEILQYLRMMEEQAEYDMEALGRDNDIISEKEKEVQDSEIELEFYRNNFFDQSSVHNLQSENNVCDD